MKNQFKQSRSTMLFSAVTKLLQVELFGDLNPTQYHRLEEIVDEFLDSQDGREWFHDQLATEVSNAIVAEVVLKHDAETIERLTNLSTKSVLEFDTDDILEKANLISDAMSDIFPKQSTNQFIITSPLVISMLQSSNDSMYVVAKEGTFRGLNNTMLVGRIDDASVYSYLFDNESEVEAQVVLGYHNEGSDKFEFVSLNIKL